MRPGLTPVEPASVFTVGHSKRSTEAFVALLKAGRVDLVVDIRCTPRSRTNPQFNLDTLPEALSVWQIGHTRIAELGARSSTLNSLVMIPTSRAIREGGTPLAAKAVSRSNAPSTS